MEKALNKLLSAREAGSILALIVLVDVAAYRGHGYAGAAALTVGAPLLLWLGSQPRRRSPAMLLLGAMLLALGLRLMWSGDQLQVVLGITLTAGFAAARAGISPHLLETAVFASQTIHSGYVELSSQFDFLRHLRIGGYRFRWLSVALPAGALMLFGLLFTMANPDLLAALGENLERGLRAFRRLLSDVVPRPLEMMLWAAVGWIALGALRPLMRPARMDESEAEAEEPAEAPLFSPFRNMLVAVIALFAAYLVFEFKTLWFRKFPAGFHYSGYAHEGAAWLTVALGLATVILSAVLRGATLADLRCRQLRTLAWIWSAENLLLAVAVFNRLNIYVGFNGMTRMRVIGYFGISAVVGGLLVVVWKIARGKNFRWLVRRQLWVVGAAVCLYALTPVDAWVMRHNVGRILAGDLAPAVQISVHPINDEGCLQLPPLLEAEDARIREGVRAMLHHRWLLTNVAEHQAAELGWTAYQGSRRRLARSLGGLQAEFTQTSAQRDDARRAFYEYAYQWY